MSEHGTSGGVAQLVDTVRPAIPFWQFCFLAPTATVTITGYFCDLHGFPVSPDGGTTWSYTGVVTATTPITLLTLFSLAVLPVVKGEDGRKAAGFVGQLSASITFCAASQDMLTVPAAVSADMVTNVTRYPQIASSTGLRLGRA